MKPKPFNLSVTRTRLAAWIDLCTADHWTRGRLWYASAHAFAEELSSRYSILLDRVIGVLAVLSVQNRWDRNKRDCEAICKAQYEGLDLDDVGTTSYELQRQKAISILRGIGPVEDLIGTQYAPKTRSFYDNILCPDTSYRVTIDRWIFRGLDLERFTKGGGNRYVALYRHLEELFRQAALRANVRPCQLQAAVWCCIQETAKVENWDGSRPGTGLADNAEEVPF